MERLTEIPAYHRPVVVLTVQHPSQVFKGLHTLNEFHLLFPGEAEGRLRASARDCDVPPPPPHLSFPVAPLRPLVLYHPPCWYVHSTKITTGKRLLNLLHHRYPQEKLYVHEMSPHPSRAMRYLRAAYCWAYHRLQHPGEGNHIGNCSLTHKFLPPSSAVHFCRTASPCTPSRTTPPLLTHNMRNLHSTASSP